MADPNGGGNAGVPDAVARPRRHRSISLVWAIPILAAMVGAWLIWQHLNSQGPVITIEFKNAEGIEPGKTKVRYKDVDIGTVTAANISSDRQQVIVTAQIAKRSENLIVDDTRFWIVRPRVSFNTITGLNTLLSGVYIGIDVGKSTAARQVFPGLEAPPPVTSGTPGRLFMLHADNIGSLYVGAPAYYRRVPVGNVTGYTLDPDRKGVTLEIFIGAPNDALVTNNTRFWHASGIDASVEATGLKINIESIVSVLVGGIAFEALPDAIPAPVLVPVPPVPPAIAGASFRLYPDRAAALKNFSEEVHTYLLYFKESLRGLAPGAPVDFHGIVIGEVRAVSMEYDRETQALRFPVEIAIFPERMRSRYRVGGPEMSAMEKNPKVLLDRMVVRGFRAQLKNANLITGQLYVALDLFPHAPPAKIDWTKKPVVLPTVAAPLEDIQETLGNIARKLDRVPFDAIGADLDHTLKTLNQTLQGADQMLSQVKTGVLPELQGTLSQARQALGNAERLLSPEAPVQENLQQTLKEVSRAAQAVRVLTDYLSRHPESLLRGKKDDSQ